MRSLWDNVSRCGEPTRCAVGYGFEAGAVSAEDLQAETRRRRVYWRGTRDSPLRHGVFGHWMLRHLTIFQARSTAQFTAIIVLGLLFFMFPLVGSLALVAMLTGLFMRAAESAHRPRASPWIFGATCPSCRYDLSGLDAFDAFDAERSPVTGPKACPECGLAWPLLPPPIPANAGSAARRS